MPNSSAENPKSPSDDAIADSPSGLERAYKSPAAWLRFLLPAIIGIIADLWLKAWSFPDGVPPPLFPLDGPQTPAGRNPAGEFHHVPTPIIDHFLGFSTTVNHGAVFGYFQGMASLFLLFSIVAMAVILWVFVTSRKNHILVHITLGMITAGALGNLYDRARFLGVRDMLRFYVSWYPYIFNIADALLCIAVPLLMLRWLFVKEAPK